MIIRVCVHWKVSSLEIYSILDNVGVDEMVCSEKNCVFLIVIFAQSHTLMWHAMLDKWTAFILTVRKEMSCTTILGNQYINIMIILCIADVGSNLGCGEQLSEGPRVKNARSRSSRSVRNASKGDTLKTLRLRLYPVHSGHFGANVLIKLIGKHMLLLLLLIRECHLCNKLYNSISKELRNLVIWITGKKQRTRVIRHFDYPIYFSKLQRPCWATYG